MTQQLLKMELTIPQILLLIQITTTLQGLVDKKAIDRYDLGLLIQSIRKNLAEQMDLKQIEDQAKRIFREQVL